MKLAVKIRHRLGSFLLDAHFETGGGLVALFGRSGAGKTSIVNCIAGLIRPEHGRISIGDVTLVDTERSIFVPCHRRRIGYVFQESRLFPHLTVRQNLLYGRWFAPKSERREDFDTVVELLGIGGLLGRRPAGLSGGEKQRVAIGRALLSSPRALLMDEPLASLDEARKAEILPYIERLRDHSRLPIIYVSHSIAEVTRLASTVVLLSEGKVVAVGPVSEVMQRLNLFPLTGRAEAGAIIEAVVERHDAEFGLTELSSRAGRWRLGRLDVPVGTRIRLRVQARDVILARSQPSDLSTLNVMAGTVAEISRSDGPIVDVRVNCNGEDIIARITRYSLERLSLAPGVPVFALIKTVALDRRSPSGPMDAAAFGADSDDAC